MDDFIAFNEDTLHKISDSEQGRKILEKLQKLHKAFGKLSKDERKLFAEAFEDQFQAATNKLESIHLKDEEVIETSSSFPNLIFVIAVILIGEFNF
jgi:hypothetical protein